jgi:hypothetical protein
MAKQTVKRDWTKEDIRTLKTLAREKTKTSVIARRLKRSVGATYQQASKLGVSLGTPRKKRTGQGGQTDPEQVVPPYALRGDVQAGVRVPRSVRNEEGWHQRVRCSVHAVRWAGYKGPKTFGERMMALTATQRDPNI